MARKPPRECGTPAGYRAHRQRGEHCDTCEDAQAARVRADQRQRLNAIDAAGGSPWGDILHRWLGDAPCNLCRPKANAAYAANKRRNRAGRRLTTHKEPTP